MIHLLEPQKTLLATLWAMWARFPFYTWVKYDCSWGLSLSAWLISCLLALGCLELTAEEPWVTLSAEKAFSPSPAQGSSWAQTGIMYGCVYFRPMHAVLRCNAFASKVVKWYSMLREGTFVTWAGLCCFSTVLANSCCRCDFLLLSTTKTMANPSLSVKKHFCCLTFVKNSETS